MLARLAAVCVLYNIIFLLIRSLDVRAEENIQAGVFASEYLKSEESSASPQAGSELHYRGDSDSLVCTNNSTLLLSPYLYSRLRHTQAFLQAHSVVFLKTSLVE
jgi:hypothetical protein